MNATRNDKHFRDMHQSLKMMHLLNTETLPPSSFLENAMRECVCFGMITLNPFNTLKALYSLSLIEEYCFFIICGVLNKKNISKSYHSHPQFKMFFPLSQGRPHPALRPPSKSFRCILKNRHLLEFASTLVARQPSKQDHSAFIEMVFRRCLFANLSEKVFFFFLFFHLLSFVRIHKQKHTMSSSFFLF